RRGDHPRRLRPGQDAPGHRHGGLRAGHGRGGQAGRRHLPRRLDAGLGPDRQRPRRDLLLLGPRRPGGRGGALAGRAGRRGQEPGHLPDPGRPARLLRRDHRGHGAGPGRGRLSMADEAGTAEVWSDGAAVRHLYWGPRVPRPAAASLLAAARDGQPGEGSRTWGSEGPDEYVPWGGLRFDEPSLKVEYADGTRAIEWRYAGQRISRDGGAVTLELDLADVAYDLTVTLAYRIYDGFDVLERWATLRNTG